jgi:hypothetical protein
MWRFGLAAIVLGEAACGAMGTPQSRAAARGECETLCRREATCSSAEDRDDGACLDECEADLGGGGYRSDVIDDITTCLDDGGCFADAAQCMTACTPTDTHEEFEQLCRVKEELCGGNGALCETTPSPTDPEIGFACVYTETVMKSLEHCLERSCATLEECFGDVLATSGLGHQTHLRP